MPPPDRAAPIDTRFTALRDLWRRWGRERDATTDRSGVIAAIRTSAAFRTGLDDLADRLGRDRGGVEKDATRYLDEMVTVQSDAFPDFNLVLSRIADRRKFEGVVEYDERALERVRSYNEVSPLVMMTGHRSYLDFVVRLPFARGGFDREFRFAGANIGFWPMGRIGHSAGIIFIRRGFRDPVYSFVLRQYVGWLTEQGANFLWALEGGRSRTGKLLPPKAGLLAYVAGAYADGRTADVTLVPATVVYEYLDEVHEYARYGRGAPKSGESLLFTVRLARQQRRVPAEARIYVGIGEPVSLAAFVDRTADHAAEAFSASVLRAAIEVCRRIEAATPITGVALVLLALLDGDGIQLRVDELVTTLGPVVADIDRRGLPAPEPGIGGAASVRRALGLLTRQGLIEVDGSGDRATYRVRPGRSFEAAYYRNAIVHYFAVPAIAEIALAMSESAADPLTAFWRKVGELRQILHHEFFFPEGDAFDKAIAEELRSQLGPWEPTLACTGGASILLGRLPRPHIAPRALGPFLEAHKIVADGLARLGSQPVLDERQVLNDCRARAELDLELGRIRRRDATSLNMLDLAMQAAHARGHALGSAGEERGSVAQKLAVVLEAVATLDTEGRHAEGALA